MTQIWSELTKFDYWLQIEKLVVEEWARLGMIPADDAKAIEESAIYTPQKIKEYENRTKHDFAAFVDVLADSVGEAGKWIHFGLTSSDVIDTALSLQMRDALNQISERLELLIALVWRMQSSHSHTLMIGRTHNVHAEPTTLGHKLRLWALELQRHQKRISDTRDFISVGSISGTVGTYSTVDPRVEEGVCLALDLRAEPSKQVISRDRHADFVWVLATIATTLDAIATEIRLLAHTEIGELAEGFVDGQKGSSAMPHKKNPVRCERISGLARVVRGYVNPILENNVTWHERDISNSSVERIILPDASSLVDYMLMEMYEILSNLVINENQMQHNLSSNNQIIYSHRLMLALIKKGLSRQRAYEIMQKSARLASERKITLRQVAYGTQAITDLLTDKDIEECFDPKKQRGFPEYDNMLFEEVR